MGHARRAHGGHASRGARARARSHARAWRPAPPASASRCSAAALRSPHDVSAAGVDPERGALLRLEGFAASVEARTRALVRRARAARRKRCSTALRRASAGTRLASAAALAASPVVWRISVPPADALRVLERARARPLSARLGRRADHSRRTRASMRRACAARCTSGHATLLKAPLAARGATPCSSRSRRPSPPRRRACATRSIRAAY